MRVKNQQELHKKNQSVELILAELEQLLTGPNDTSISSQPNSDLPNIFVVGCARSGTTFLTQFLTDNLEVSYPSNFLSRFYYAPYIGSKIQYLFSDLDQRNELLGGLKEINYKSNLGKTEGPLAPHEFWYFWRKIFGENQYGYIDQLNPDTLKQFHSGLDSIKQVFNKPLVLKGMIANPVLSQIVKPSRKDLIVYVKRDLTYNAQSILQARKEYFGDINSWYSFKVPDKSFSDNPFEQVCQQVKFTNEMIEKELAKLPKENYHILDYDHLKTELPLLIDRLKNQCEIQSSKEINFETVKASNKIQLAPLEWEQLQHFSKMIKTNNG
ncbi:MAG: sulfotransferase [Bacteroidetes bacterium]|nr:sulfotransferase [Bacteroidota bacterium]